MEFDTPPRKEFIEVPPEEPKKEKERPPEESREVQVVDTKIVGPSPAGGEGLRGKNVIIGTLNVFNAPVERFVAAPMRERYHRHYHSRHKHGRKHLIADIVLALTVIALIGVNIYALFFAGGPKLLERVKMTIATTPETVVSGDRVTFTIDYQNENDAALFDAKLAVLLPKNFRLLETRPSTFDAQNHTFTIGAIEARGNGSVMLSGQLIGSIGTAEKISAALSYGSAEGGKRETKAMGFTIPIAETALRLTITLPNELVHEGAAPFTIRYANRGSIGLERVMIALQLGDVFTLLESSEKFVGGTLALPLLPSGGEGEVRGRLAIRGNGDATTAFIVRTLLGDILQHEEKQTASLFYPQLSVTPKVEQPFSLGGEAVLSFTYENKEDGDVVDLAITLDPPAAIFVRDTATSFVYGKAQDPSLALVRKGAGGSATFALPTKATLDRKEVFGDGDPVVYVPYTIFYRLARAPEREIRIERVHAWKLTTDLAIDAFGRYFTPEGDQLGRGVLPPRVNETTRYWVFVPLTNTISDVADVMVSLVLGENVEWTKKSSVTLGDPLSYDERARTLTWRIPLVTKFSGGAYPDVGAAVELALTPTAADVGSEPLLLTDVGVRGRDTFTNATIERAAAPVTTLLSVDRRAKEKSKVVP